MAENDTGQERTEEATPKRREEVRRKGQVAKSAEITSVAVLFVCMGFFYFNATFMLEKMGLMMRDTFLASGRTRIGLDNIYQILSAYADQVLVMLGPLFLLVVGMAVLVNLLQVGVMFSPESLMPKFSKIDPIKGFGRLFSVRMLVELVKTILKILIVAGVAYAVLESNMIQVMNLLHLEVVQFSPLIGKISFQILLGACAILVILAVLDYLFQRQQFEKSIKMTKEELKQEMKNTEGDPIVRARVRKIQREMAKKRMMAAVPTADVVITNPTHIAVALKYDQAVTAAPIVVAKGVGEVAERIKEIAREHGVPVVENKSVARLLYQTVKLDSPIPETLYRAVAEILAYVYRLKGSTV